MASCTQGYVVWSSLYKGRYKHQTT